MSLMDKAFDGLHRIIKSLRFRRHRLGNGQRIVSHRYPRSVRGHPVAPDPVYHRIEFFQGNRGDRR